MALAAAGVAFEVVPGVTAAFAVPAYAGVPVTQRGLATSVTVVTGRVGDVSAGGVDWEALARAGGTVVVLMGMEHRAEIARRLMAGGRAAEEPVAVVEWGTTAAQRSVRTVLGELGAVELGAPATIVVGPVAGLGLDWFAPGPLAGRRVVVTRAAARAGALLSMLEAAGASVVSVPVVRTAEPEDGGAALAGALERVRGASWIALTSVVAVERVLAGVRDGRALAAVRIACVGPATAEALRARFLEADLVADPATAEGLVAAMPEPPSDGGLVLYPKAAGASSVVGDGLRAKGWEVEEVVAYRTVAVASDEVPAGLLDEAATAEVVTFTSPSTVSAYLALAGDRPVPPVVACIGPVTARAARQAGLEVALQADEHSAEGLVTALVAHVAALRG
jgi:uroporphyrinogen III methyltransferase/synthase